MIDEQELPPDVLVALSKNRKLEAIKRLRAYGEFDLKEAKAVIDSHYKNNPNVYPPIQKESGVGRLVLLVLFVAGACAAYFLMS